MDAAGRGTYGGLADDEEADDTEAFYYDVDAAQLEETDEERTRRQEREEEERRDEEEQAHYENLSVFSPYSSSLHVAVLVAVTSVLFGAIRLWQLSNGCVRGYCKGCRLMVAVWMISSRMDADGMAMMHISLSSVAISSFICQYRQQHCVFYFIQCLMHAQSVLFIRHVLLPTRTVHYFDTQTFRRARHSPATFSASPTFLFRCHLSLHCDRCLSASPVRHAICTPHIATAKLLIRHTTISIHNPTTPNTSTPRHHTPPTNLRLAPHSHTLHTALPRLPSRRLVLAEQSLEHDQVDDQQWNAQPHARPAAVTGMSQRQVRADSENYTRHECNDGRKKRNVELTHLHECEVALPPYALPGFVESEVGVEEHVDEEVEDGHGPGDAGLLVQVEEGEEYGDGVMVDVDERSRLAAKAEQHRIAQLEELAHIPAQRSRNTGG